MTATVPGAQGGPPLFRRARFDDYDRISALQSRYGMRTRSREEWAHLWNNNPVIQELPDWPIGWVFESGEAIVGHIANVPLKYVFAGSTILAATSGDLVVERQYRLYAFRLLGQYLSQKNITLLLGTTANPSSSQAHEKLHIPRVPAGVWDRSMFWITDYRSFMSSVFAKKQAPLAGLLSGPLSLGLRLKGIAAARRLRARTGKIDFCTAFDDRFEYFWKRLQRKRTGVLLADRSAPALTWHFRNSLVAGKAWIITTGVGSEISAYSVFIKDDRPAIGLQRIRLVDFQTVDGTGEGLVPMLAAALDRCKAEGVAMLETVGFAHAKKDIIESLAPYTRPLPAWPYFYKVNDTALAEVLRNPCVWDPSCFDGDASL